MTIGDGIFWLGLFYGLAHIIEQWMFYFVSHFPGKNISRLDRVEQVLRDAGMEI